MHARTRPTRFSDFVGLLKALDPGRPRALLLLAIAFASAMFVVQASTLGAPINGEHNWRQADTYSVAYNFFHERASFFYPRIDWAGERSGIMGMETPVYTYATSLLMRVLGDAPLAGRLFNWIVLTLAFLIVARSFRLTPRDWPVPSGAAAPNPWWIPIGIITFGVLSPLVFFEGRQFQPDPAMAAFTAMAAACFYAFARRERPWLYVAGLLFYSIGVTTKAPVLVAGPAMWLLTFTATRRLRWYQPLIRGVPLLLPLALYVAWDKWAHHLNEAFAGGSTYFALEFDRNDFLRRIQDPAVLKRVFWFVIPSYSSNWVLFPVLASGMILGFRRGLRSVSIPMLIWFIMGAGLCAGLERLHWHWYYTFIFMLPLVYFGGVGLAALFEAVAAYRHTTLLVRWAFWFMTLALLATSWAGGPPHQLEQVIGASQPLNNSWTSEDGFFGLFVLQLVALAISTFGPAKSGQWVSAVTLAAAIFVAVPRAASDVWQIFLWRSRASEWVDWDTHWKELRKAVTELSTRQDRFVVDGGNPWFLHLVLRKGFAFYGHDMDSLGIGYFNARSIRFYAHFPQNGPISNIVHDRTPMRSSDRWEIYCIDVDGCGSATAR